MSMPPAEGWRGGSPARVEEGDDQEDDSLPAGTVRAIQNLSTFSLEFIDEWTSDVMQVSSCLPLVAVNSDMYARWTCTVRHYCYVHVIARNTIV